MACPECYLVRASSHWALANQRLISARLWPIRGPGYILGLVLAISGLEIKPPAPAKSWIGLGKHRAGLLEHYLITHGGVISDDFTIPQVFSFMFLINRPEQINFYIKPQ